MRDKTAGAGNSKKRILLCYHLIKNHCITWYLRKHRRNVVAKVVSIGNSICSIFYKILSLCFPICEKLVSTIDDVLKIEKMPSGAWPNLRKSLFKSLTG